jgi:uncharacterized DUF497 family protein
LIYYVLLNLETHSLNINDFEWDEGNLLRIELRHGIEPAEAEEIFAVRLLFPGKKGHYTAMEPTLGGRYLTLVFALEGKGFARVINGWDMNDAEKRYYLKNKKR